MNYRSKKWERTRQMKPAHLTDEQRESFERDGYLHVENVLDSDEIAQYTKACDHLIDDFRSGRLPTKMAPYAKYLQTRENVVQNETLRPILTHSPTVPFIIQLLSPNIHLHTAAVIYKDPEDEDHGPRNWHRDIGLTPDLGHSGQIRAGIKVCYCLTDFSEIRSGITMFARGSHLLSEPLGIPKGSLDPPEMVELTSKAGDAILFENRTFHSMAPNVSVRIAKVIIYGYSYRWMREDLRHLRLPDAQLIAANPIEQQLLGGVPSEKPGLTTFSDHFINEWAIEHGLDAEEIPFTVEI